MGSHMPLPPGSGDVPAFTPAEAGTRFSDLEGRKTELKTELLLDL